jgi:Uma2 family endonuclease
MTQTAEPHSYHWTKAQYYAMAELGFFESQRVELIEGEIIEMSPMSSQHAGVVVLVQPGWPKSEQSKKCWMPTLPRPKA